MNRLITILILGFLNQALTAQVKSLTVDGCNFRIKTAGKSDFTIIFESGIALELETWSPIDDSVASFAKVFLYDRAGIGESGLSKNKRTIPNYVKELNLLLKQEKLPAPYIFVSHSMGGYISRYYAWKYPDETKALLLIDPSAEMLYSSLDKKELKKYRKRGDKFYAEKSLGAQLEWENFLENKNYMYEINLKKDIPIVLISAKEAQMTEYQRLIISNHPNSKLIELDGGHFIHNEKPDFIISEIKKLIQKYF